VTLMNKWAGKPLPISATCYSDGKLFVRLTGAASAVTAARAQIGGEGMHDHREFWEGVREQQHKFFRGDNDLWRLSLPPATPPLGLAATLIEWGGAQRWVRGNGNSRKIRETVAGARGHVTLFRTSGARESVFTPLSPALAKIHRNLKRQFDPHGIFNPGRIYTDL
jgi:glycolate oxidase FAD binding subunit